MIFTSMALNIYFVTLTLTPRLNVMHTTYLTYTCIAGSATCCLRIATDCYVISSRGILCWFYLMRKIEMHYNINRITIEIIYQEKNTYFAFASVSHHIHFIIVSRIRVPCEIQ